MIDSQQAAQLLYSHQLATQEQILACWPEITAEKDIGMVLVEKGLLSAQTYQELAAYLNAASPAQETQVGAQINAHMGANPSPHAELPIESHQPLPADEIAPVEPDENILGWEEENWSPAPPGDEEPTVRKSTRAEHNLKKAAASAAAIEPFIESRPPVESVSHSSASASGAPASQAASAAPALDPIASAGARNGSSQGTEGTIRAGGNVRVIDPDAPMVQAPQAVGPETSWDELLAFARQCDAADLHLSAGNPILLRRYGSLQAATRMPMEQTSLRVWVTSALTLEQLERFEKKGDLELIYALKGWGRYRVTILKQRRGWDVTARVIPARIRSFEETGMPESCRELTKWAQGLVLVTGPVGCGKSSTLATLVDMVNQERHDHVITIEEPIEIVYEPAHCRITQRQIGPHTLTRDAALRAALREDPDIIVISELRDLDTIRLAVSAAETGHLVFGTMNTTNAARTLYRLIDSFPPEEQGIIRNMISESLRGVISQQLVPRKDGQGMVPAFEVLLINTAVANMIRKDEAHQLHTAMLTGKSSGMVLLDDSLRTLLDRGLVDVAEVIPRATVPKDFEKGGRR